MPAATAARPTIKLSPILADCDSTDNGRKGSGSTVMVTAVLVGPVRRQREKPKE